MENEQDGGGSAFLLTDWLLVPEGAAGVDVDKKGESLGIGARGYRCRKLSGVQNCATRSVASIHFFLAAFSAALVTLPPSATCNAKYGKWNRLTTPFD